MINIGLITQIISAIVILIALGISYGKLSSKVDMMGKQMEKINGCVDDHTDMLGRHGERISNLEGRGISSPKINPT